MATAAASSKRPGAGAAKRPATPPAPITLAEAMAALEKAGSAQTRKTWARHGVTGPMFGVSFATLKALVKRIRVDHELALALWKTGNYDARNLAVKIADPARMRSADLERWARQCQAGCGSYVAALAAEGLHAAKEAPRWLASTNLRERCTGWDLVAYMAARDELAPDAWFGARLAEIERAIHDAPNLERERMNRVVIAIGGRSQALRQSALAAARRIGAVEVDHGDTYCETPDAAAYIEKMWAHATAKGFPSPAAQERTRELPRIRC